MSEKINELDLDYELAARCFLAGYEVGRYGMSAQEAGLAFSGFLATHYDFEDEGSMARIATDAIIKVAAERTS